MKDLVLSGFIWQWQEEEYAFAWLSLHICSVLHQIWSSYFTIPLQAGNLDYGSVTTLIFIDKSWSLLVELWASWIILSLCNEANILLPAWGFEFNVTKNKGSFLCAFPLPLPLPLSFLLFFFPSLFSPTLVLFPSFLPFLFCFFQNRDANFQNSPAVLVVVLVWNGKGLFQTPAGQWFGGGHTVHHLQRKESHLS